MSEYVFNLPDLGEGTVEAEIVEWRVRPGDRVREGDIIADVMTDKANVEVPAPVSGTVLRTTGAPGDTVPVGAELIAFEVGGAAGSSARTTAASRPQPTTTAPPVEPVARTDAAAPAPGGQPPTPVTPPTPPGPTPAAPTPAAAVPAAPPAQATPPLPSDQAPSAVETPTRMDTAAEGVRVRTSPAVRRRAKESGIDLGSLSGSGPRGRILMKDLDALLSQGVALQPPAPSGVGDVEEVKVIGVRRLIASRLQAAKQQIPHFAFVEEVDVTALESLRQHLNGNRAQDTAALTYLPFIAIALIRSLREFPQCNAHFDAERGVLRQFKRVHLGIATQTPDGLKVPVVHNADARGLWPLAAEIARVAEAARDNSASRAELTGSTVTLTSLGRLGGIASTPVINAPETTIIGVNKAMERPMVVDGQIAIRRMMNLSSSFDHRFVDGHDGASLIQRMRGYLEQPATLFID